jgi:1-acyl-sn-glycerol-3-phosphate acyltransferase
MARTILWYVAFWLLQLLSLPCLVIVLLLQAAGRQAARDKILFLTVRTWARLLIAFAGARVAVSGLENLPAQGGTLFISNHQGAFDIPLLLGYVPGLKGFVSKKEASRLPIVGAWIRQLRCIVLDRGNMRQSARAIARGVGDLRAGRSLIVFPEGTRSKSGTMGRFKDGSFQLATRSGAAIVPLTIDGSYRLLEGHQGRITPGTVQLHIHPGIRVQGLSTAEKKNLAATVQRIVASRLTL